MINDSEELISQNKCDSDPPACSVNCEDPVDYHSEKLPTVIFMHGKESGPWGEKIVALAEVARSRGHTVESIDFRDIDKPDDRVKHLLESVSEMKGPFILVGSSMGSYVALRSSKNLSVVGLFLMAPAVGLAGYMDPYPVPVCKRITIIHAWQDIIIPVHNVIDFAEKQYAELYIVNSDHRLSGQIPFLEQLFDRFLNVGNEKYIP